MQQINKAINPSLVSVKDGKVFADSRDVADAFEKNHKDVLKAIRNLVEKDPDMLSLNFAPFKINDLTGESTSHYEMTRDGFTLLVMGFTGQKALQWKLRYIEAFNRMEDQLRSSSQAFPAALADPKTLRALLLDYNEKVLQLQNDIDDMRPQVQALERIAVADGSMSITAAAKTLQIQPKVLFTFMRMKGWIYRRDVGSSDLGYQAKLQAGLLEHKIHTVHRPDGTEKVVTQVRVTAKGLTRLAQELSPPPLAN